MSLAFASNGAYRVVPASVATLNHHQGGIPAWRGVSTEQINLRPESSNSKSVITLALYADPSIYRMDRPEARFFFARPGESPILQKYIGMSACCDGGHAIA